MSLTTCIRKAGEHLRPEDKSQILLRARELRGEGLRPDDAGVSAISEQADAVQQMLDAAEAGLAQAKDASTQHQRAAEDKANAARQGDMFQEDFAGTDDSVETARLVSSRGDTAPGGNINSAGQKISGTKQGLKNFWAWFGNSDAVDDKGRPLVMYHSTRGDISRFESGRPTTNNYGLLGDVEVKRAGIFVTPDADFSQEYLRSGDGQNVMQVYLKLEQPLDLREGLSEVDEEALEKGGVSTRMIHNIQNHWELFDADDNGKSEFVDALRELGYDGAIFNEDRRNGGRAVTYMAFDPGQLKSATGNAGTFDASNPDITKSTERAWYSQLQSAIEQAPARLGDMAAAQWAQWLKANAAKMGVKQDEITWSGIEDYLQLRGKDKLSRDELAAWVGENGVKVEEVVLGDRDLHQEFETVRDAQDFLMELHSQSRAELKEDYGFTDERDYIQVANEAFANMYPDSAKPTKYGDYTLPGGTNYREVLLTLPAKAGPEPLVWTADRMREKRGQFIDDMGFAAETVDAAIGYVDEAGSVEDALRMTDARVGSGVYKKGTPLVRDMLRGLVVGAKKKNEADKPATYKSNHWDQPNILAHIRLNDRVDTDGKKVLFVEEIQSDWGQAAKKKGFQEPAPAPVDKLPDGWTVERKNGQLMMRDQNGEWAGGRTLQSWDTDADMMRKAVESYNEMQAARAKGDGVPRAPFVDKTDKWLALALKRVIKMAVDGGYDKVAFVTGAQSAERFSLDQQLKGIRWEPEGDGFSSVAVYPHQGDAIGLTVSRETGAIIANNEFHGKDLDEVVGKEVAAKILAAAEGELVGDGLKVEAHGMRAFYDQIVPQVLRDVLKKVGGGALAPMPLNTTGQGRFSFERGPSGVRVVYPDGTKSAWQESMEAARELTRSYGKQPGFDVTPAMREKAADGLPLFSVYRNDPALESWAEAALAGQHTRDAYKKVSPSLPHPAWLMAGLDSRLPVTIDRRLVSHLRRAGHEEVTAGMIGRLADLMAHPRVMIRNEDVDGNGQRITRHQALLDARDEQGRPLLVAVRQSKEGGGDVYDVRSMFGRNESMRYVLDQLRQGNVVWMADKEAAALRDFTGRGTMPRTGQKPGAQPARTATTVIVPGDAAAQNYPTKGWKQGGNSITIPADTRRAEGVAFSAGRDPQTETPEFKAWFGDSKVVDEQGEPLRVYTGTSSDVDFKSFRAPKNGIWFTDSAEGASQYAVENDSMGLEYDGHKFNPKNSASRVIPAYLSIKNPKVYTEWPESIMRATNYRKAQGLVWETLRAQGHDGVIADIAGSKIIVAFDAKQIKSAIGNNGGFDPGSKDITKSADRDEINSAQEHWASPGASKFDDIVYKLQDKHVDTKRVLQAVKDAGGTLRDDLDVYLQEELFHGRAAKRTEDFVHHELQPLIDQMSEEGLQISDLDEYLHARHAREANEVIKRRNPEIQDGGSGMLNQDAEAYFAETDATKLRKLEAAAAHVDRMLAKTRELLVDYQLESRAKVQGWADMFEHYVPLMREDEGGHSGGGTGQGFSIKGKEVKSRTGSTRKVVDILANIAMQRERTIVRGEKNRVSQALFGLAASNPNPEFWQVDTHVPSEQVFNPKTGLVEDRPDNLYKQRPNVLVTKITDADGNVHERAVVFNEKNERAMRMAESLKNLDAAQLEGLLGASAKLTRYFASINTQYNPVFGVVNLVRDMQGALVNLGTTEIADKKADVAQQAMSALRGIYGDLRATRKGGTASSPWAQLWEEFQSVGGQTGFRQLFATSNDRAEAIKSALDPTAWMDSKLGKIFTANGTLKVPLAAAQRGAKWIFDWLSDYNTAMENGVRLAAYKTALDAGLSKERAASLAKNLTVNFNRKGQAAQQAGALYAFFNASAQGTARLGSVLLEMEPGKPKTARLSPLGKKVVYGGMMLGSMQALALAAAGFSDDDPPEWARERALIIPTGNKTYVTIPLPLGLHVIPNIGRVTTAWALGGFKDTAKHGIGLLGSLADAFNPIGNAGLSMQTLAPTALDPLVALTENRDWSGRPIARESSNKATPGHALARDTASSWSKLISEGINYLSGGTKHTAGVLSPTPDQIDYLVSQVTGGVGRELTKLEQTGLGAVRGEEVPLYKVPLVGRFVGNAKSQASEGNAFYANVERLNELETEIKGLKGEGKTAEVAALKMQNPQAYLITQANHAERQVQKLRKEKSELVKAGAPREQIVAIEAKITERMAALNRAVEKLKAD